MTERYMTRTKPFALLFILLRHNVNGFVLVIRLCAMKFVSFLAFPQSCGNTFVFALVFSFSFLIEFEHFLSSTLAI